MLTHQNLKPINPGRVIIYGANGFIGQMLKARLASEGISHLCLTRKDFDFAEFNAAESLASILTENDTLVILAAITPDKGRGIDPFYQNISIMKNICKALEKVTPAHIVYFSSDAVYSVANEVVHDNTLPSPDDLYGVMHYARELMIKTTSQAPVTILRPTLIYGALDTHNSYGPNRLRRMANQNKEIMLFGQGEEMRDHVYAEDVVELTLLTMQHKSVGTLNIATGKSISYWDLAHKVAANFDQHINIQGSERKTPINHRHYNVSELHEAFPSFKFTPLDVALGRAYNDMMKEMKA